MVGHDHRYVAVLKQTATRGADAHFRIQQGLRRRAPKRDKQAGPHKLDLARKIGQARSKLTGFGRTIVRWPAFHRIGNINIRPAFQPERGQHVIKQFTRLADKGFATRILFRPWPFPDEHPTRLPVANPWHSLLASLAQNTRAAFADVAFQRLPFQGGDTPLPIRRGGMRIRAYLRPNISWAHFRHGHNR